LFAENNFVYLFWGVGDRWETNNNIYPCRGSDKIIFPFCHFIRYNWHL